MSLSRRRTTAVLTAAGLAAAAATAALLTGGAPAGAAPGTPACPATPSFTNTIPAPQGPPAAVSLPGGVVGFSIVGPDTKTYYVDTDISGDPLSVGPLACFGGGAIDNPSVAPYGTGLAFFVRAPNGVIYQNYVTGAETPVATGWTKVPNGTAGGGPAAVAGANGAVDLFIRGTNGALYQATRSRAGAWTAFRSLGGGMVGTPAVAPKPGGGYIAVITAPTGYLYTRSSNSAGVWGAWTRLTGTAASSPTITAGFAAGRLDLFVIGQTGGLYQNVYTAGKFSTTFKKIESTVLPTTRVAAAASPGRMIVYITETYGPGDSATAYTQYLPGGWTEARTGEPYLLAPYTWEDGAPAAGAADRRAAGSGLLPGTGKVAPRDAKK